MRLSSRFCREKPNNIQTASTGLKKGLEEHRERLCLHEQPVRRNRFCANLKECLNFNYNQRSPACSPVFFYSFLGAVSGQSEVSGGRELHDHMREVCIQGYQHVASHRNPAATHIEHVRVSVCVCHKMSHALEPRWLGSLCREGVGGPYTQNVRTQ